MRESKVIKAWRDHLGLSQLQLADTAGVARSSMSGWETGRKRPSYTTMLKIARAIGVDTVLEFLDGPPGFRKDNDSNPQEMSRNIDTVVLPWFAKLTANLSSPESEVEFMRSTITGNPDDLVVVHKNTDSMFSFIHVGDDLVIDTSKRKPKSGQIVAAVVDGRPMFRRFRIENKKRILAADHPDYPDMAVDDAESVEYLGVVVKIMRDV